MIRPSNKCSRFETLFIHGSFFYDNFNPQIQKREEVMMIGDFLRSSGKHVTYKAIGKSGKLYSKANSELKKRAKRMIVKKI